MLNFITAGATGNFRRNFSFKRYFRQNVAPHVEMRTNGEEWPVNKDLRISALKKEIRDLSQMIVIYEREQDRVKNIDDAINSYFIYNEEASVELLVKYCSLFGYDQAAIGQKIWQMLNDEDLYLTSDHYIRKNTIRKISS